MIHVVSDEIMPRTLCVRFAIDALNATRLILCSPLAITMPAALLVHLVADSPLPSVKNHNVIFLKRMQNRSMNF